MPGPLLVLAKGSKASRACGVTDHALSNAQMRDVESLLHPYNELYEIARNGTACN